MNLVDENLIIYVVLLRITYQSEFAGLGLPTCALLVAGTLCCKTASLVYRKIVGPEPLRKLYRTSLFSVVKTKHV